MVSSKNSLVIMLVSLALITCQSSSSDETPQTESQRKTVSHEIDYIFLDVENYEEFSSNIENPQEVLAQLTYYSENKEVFSSPVGIRLSGIFIKKMPQKSISVEFSKKRFGSTKCKHNIWPHRDYDDVDGFVIRAHGNPLKNTFYLDGLANLILEEHTDLEYSSYAPVILYLNGEYHGLFNLREKKNKDFIDNIFDIGKENIELLEINGGKNNKPNAHWEDVYNFCKTKDLSIAANYQYVSDRIEISNFIDYHIAETFLANIDWPMANVKVWKNTGGKWRWLFFDCDRGIQNVSFNMLEHISGVNQWDETRVDKRLIAASQMMRSLMKNETFKERFLIRYQDLMNSTFNADYMLSISKKLKANIESEVPRQINYWKDKENEFSFNTVKSMNMWLGNITLQDRFLSNRGRFVYEQLRTTYGLGQEKNIHFDVSSEDAGKIRVNTDFLPKSSFTGKYFPNLPLEIEAVPFKGYEFDHWEGHNSKKILITPSASQLDSLTAVFIKL